jgi:hypothetical protein
MKFRPSRHRAPSHRCRVRPERSPSNHSTCRYLPAQFASSPTGPRIAGHHSRSVNRRRHDEWRDSPARRSPGPQQSADRISSMAAGGADAEFDVQPHALAGCPRDRPLSNRSSRANLRAREVVHLRYLCLLRAVSAHRFGDDVGPARRRRDPLGSHRDTRDRDACPACTHCRFGVASVPRAQATRGHPGCGVSWNPGGVTSGADGCRAGSWYAAAKVAPATSDAEQGRTASGLPSARGDVTCPARTNNGYAGPGVGSPERARHARPIARSIGGYTIRCRNGAITAM